MGKKKTKTPPAPLLPPEVADEDIEVSDEDFEFVNANRDFAGFLSNLDTKSIDRHVVRVANENEDALETLYERQNKKMALQKPPEEDNLQFVDSVDALPVKTLDGKLYYRAASEDSKRSENIPKEDEAAIGDNDDGDNKSVVKLTKAERRRKLKKMKKEAKKQGKELDKTNEVQVDAVPEKLQFEVLAEVKKELSMEEVFVQKKSKLAELGMALLADPESNMKSLKDILQICKDEDRNIVKLGLLSLLAIFKDIIPGYRIRLPTEKELEMTVSKAVQKMRYFESTLLHSYKAYLQKLVAVEKEPFFQHVVVRCMCDLLEAVPHFNFRESLLACVIKNISSLDDVIRKMCCTSVKALFVGEGKHGGEMTLETVKSIANHVKVNDCQLHPDCIEVFLSLSFDEDLGRPSQSEEEKLKHKNKKRKKNVKELNQFQDGEKKIKQELLTKTRQEVSADLKATSFAPDPEERKTMQSETLAALFQTYFRILKHAVEPPVTWLKVNADSVCGGYGRHPLLAPCLQGLGKFSHLIDLDFMNDIMNVLKKLAGSGCDHSASLTVSGRLQCCIVAFKVMRNNLDALNVDLHEFFIQLYNLLLEYKPEREDQGEVLAEALKIMLCEGRQHDMQRAAAFIKRLASFSLCYNSAEAFAALVTLKHLLQRNIKCRNLLENDAGGGSLSGSIAKYQPDASDPNLSGALASVLWELSLLAKHYHPTVSSAASSISNMSTDHNQVYMSSISPQQAFVDLSIKKESFNPTNFTTSKHKIRRVVGSSVSSSAGIQRNQHSLSEDEVTERFSYYFTVLKGIAEKERLMVQLNHTVSSINMYKAFKNGKNGSRTRKKSMGLNAN